MYTATVFTEKSATFTHNNIDPETPSIVKFIVLHARPQATV